MSAVPPASPPLPSATLDVNTLNSPPQPSHHTSTSSPLSIHRPIFHDSPLSTNHSIRLHQSIDLTSPSINNRRMEISPLSNTELPKPFLPSSNRFGTWGPSESAIYRSSITGMIHSPSMHLSSHHSTHSFDPPFILSPSRSSHKLNHSHINFSVAQQQQHAHFPAPRFHQRQRSEGLIIAITQHFNQNDDQQSNKTNTNSASSSPPSVGHGIGANVTVSSGSGILSTKHSLRSVPYAVPTRRGSDPGLGPRSSPTESESGTDPSPTIIDQTDHSLMNFDDRILIGIFSHFDLPSLLPLSGICKRMESLIDSNIIRQRWYMIINIKKGFQNGINGRKRGECWKILCDADELIAKMTAPPLIPSNTPSNSSDSNSVPSFNGGSISESKTLYQRLLEEELPESDSLHLGQLKKDINRTLIHYEAFNSNVVEAERCLWNVLKAYIMQDQEIGYVQAMNFIAAYLLTKLEEEEAYWLFQLIMQSARYNMRSLFLNELEGLLKLQYFLGSYIETLMPDLHTHFIEDEDEQLTNFYRTQSAPLASPLSSSTSLPSSSKGPIDNFARPELTIMGEWHLSLFTTKVVPRAFVDRIWDFLLVYGIVKGLLACTLSLLYLSRTFLLSLPNDELLMALKQFSFVDCLKDENITDTLIDHAIRYEALITDDRLEVLEKLFIDEREKKALEQRLREESLERARKSMVSLPKGSRLSVMSPSSSYHHSSPSSRPPRFASSSSINFSPAPAHHQQSSPHDFIAFIEPFSPPSPVHSSTQTAATAASVVSMANNQYGANPTQQIPILSDSSNTERKGTPHNRSANSSDGVSSSLTLPSKKDQQNRSRSWSSWFK